jgi:phosphoenolpyruvate synthase/pyruvate phosphate dikinase
MHGRVKEIFAFLKRIAKTATKGGDSMTTEAHYAVSFDDIGAADVPTVGGKNASLGEMIGGLREAGIRVPDGFATTAEAYWEFLEANDLREKIETIWRR